MSARKLSWKPVSRGAVYCSPGCGRGCTYKEFIDANAAADELVELLGPGWKPRVWENMGWYYCAVSLDGHMKVHPGCNESRPTYYTAFFGDIAAGGRWVENAKTPKAAIRKVLYLARSDRDEIQGCIDSYEKAVQP